MKPFILMKFPNGYTYQVATEVLVHHKAAQLRQAGAAVYATAEDAVVAARAMFSTDLIVQRYARFCMPWSELKQFAMLIASEPIEMRPETAEVSCQDKFLLPVLPEEMDPASVPVLLLSTVMETNGMLIHMLPVTREGAIIGAVATLSGDKDDIAAYAAVLAAFSRDIEKNRSPRQSYPH